MRTVANLTTAGLLSVVTSTAALAQQFQPANPGGNLHHGRSLEQIQEPTLKLAEQWWPDLTDYWTPVGWKHHRFRYNVFFDGTLYADPSLSQTAKDWAGQGVQLRVLPVLSTSNQQLRSQPYFLEDDRSTIQGWTTNHAPVLWTEWSKDGLLLRQQVFAMVQGAQPVRTGLEPLFAWMRLSIHQICPGLPVPKRYTFSIRFNAPHVRTSMFVRRNITMAHDKAAYPRSLSAESGVYNPRTGLRIVEPDGKLRLAVAPGAAVEARFLPGGAPGDPLLLITLDAKPGEHADLLVPMLPIDATIVEEELSQGYDRALSKADLFWSTRPDTAATIDVPETNINETIRQFERFAEVLSERVPETGKNVSLSGSLAYVKVWATPTGKMVSMFLDPLGYHDLAGEYLEPFIEAQGTIKPPSNFLESHPGYLGSPVQFKSIDWIADHGSLLHAIASHALLISKPDLKQRYVEPVLKGCEFIKHARHTTNHPGIPGILPPARYSDAAAQTQGVWSDGWNYKGLTTGVLFLRQMRHPRAQEFADEAEDYRKTFVAAFRKAATQTEPWTDPTGQSHPFVPTSLYGAVEESARHPFYLDTGPLNLVFAGLMDARDPLMQSALKWFREGPIQQYARFGASFMQPAFLRHEMSSSIPGYSWNVFHNHQLGDRKHYLEGMYSQFAGAISRQTRTVCETRGGITGRITHADTPFYLARLAVVDDVIADGELHLLRICPLAWISKERESRFVNMPTAFGPVTITWRLSQDGSSLKVNYSSKFHHQPKKCVLHIPPLDSLKEVVLDGKPHHVVPGEEIIF